MNPSQRTARFGLMDGVLFVLSALLVYFYIAPLLPAHPGVSLADNTLLTIQMITFEALRVLKNSLGIVSRINRQYDAQFGRTGAKIGTTLNIRKPPKYEIRQGNAISPQNTVETSVPLVLDTLIGVDVAFGDIERTLSLDDYSNRVLKPQLATIANRIDFDVFQLYKKVSNQVGTPGTVPAALSTYLDAGVRLKNEAAPFDTDMYMGMTPQMEATAVTSAVAYFNPTQAISDQYRKGRMGMFGGFEFFMDQNCPVHTAATQSGSVTVNGAVTSGSSLTVASLTTTGLKDGDTFQVANCTAVNPQSKQSTGQLRNFRVVGDTGADSGGALTFTFAPAIVTSGPFQNVVAAGMANTSAVTFAASTGRDRKSTRLNSSH